MTSDSYHPQSVDPDEIIKDFHLPTITPSYHPQSIGPSNDRQSDASNDGFVPEAPFGEKILEFVIATNNKSTIMPTISKSTDNGYVA